MDFFITGLPRSRTAWLANFFTTGPSYCAHDALIGCASLGDYAKKLAALPGEVRGDSDSALLAFAPAVMARYPVSRWGVVRRDAEEAERSWARMPKASGLPHPTRAQMGAALRSAERSLHEIAPSRQVLVVEFAQLSEMAVLRDLWVWCLQDRVPWSEERAQMLTRMRVEVLEDDSTRALPEARSLWREAS